jgi:hypothetical protein
MQCSKCKRESVVYQPYSGQHLCQEHLIADIESKAKRTIRQQQGMRPGDHIGIIQGRTVADKALLLFFRNLTNTRKDIRISEITGDRKTGNAAAQIHDTGVTKIANAVTLEEASAAVLTDLLRGDLGKYQPADGMNTAALPVITPFRHIPAEEILQYARILGISGERMPCSGIHDTLFEDVTKMLADYTTRHPAAPHAVLNLAKSLERSCNRSGGRP